MKSKRNILLLIISISVFCLSVIFEMQGYFYVAQENRSEVLNFLATDSSPLTEETKEAPLQSFAYVSNSATSYLLPPELEGTKEETAKISANKQSQTIDTTEPDQASLSFDATSADSSDDITAETASAVVGTTPAVTKSLSVDAKETEAVKALYSNIGISIANSFVNIRESASTDSDVLGKLYTNSAARILDTIDGWYYVESGSVKGYVNSEYIRTGIADDEIVEKYGILSILVKVDGLNVREEPRPEADKLTVIYLNESYPVIDLQEDWIKVDITDDKEIGYVKREFAELSVDFKHAVSIEEERELLKLQEKERIKKETEVQYRDESEYSQADLKLLACLVHAEAGNQSYEGKLAVANIVLNRVKSSKYPDTIKDVIYQPGQFSVAASGSLAKQLANFNDYNSNSQRLTIKAAKAALQGANNIGNRLYFHSYKSAVNEGYDNKSGCVKLDDQLYW